jgi:hypothetical protein
MQVGISTINRDAIFLRQQAQENLQNHIQQKLPEEYQCCLTGMNQVLKLSWQIANNTTRQNGQTLKGTSKLTSKTNFQKNTKNV